jgi:hypothetical protein
MFQLSESHMKGFAADNVRDFENRAIRHLRTELPEESKPYSDEELRARVQRAMARCRQYDLRTEYQIVCFVDAGMLLGEEDFDTNRGWARFALAACNMSADRRAHATLEVALRIAHEDEAVMKSIMKEGKKGGFADG